MTIWDLLLHALDNTKKPYKNIPEQFNSNREQSIFKIELYHLRNWEEEKRQRMI